MQYPSEYPPLPEANSESIHTETPAVPGIQTGEQKLSLPCPLVIFLSGLLHSLFCDMMFMVLFVEGACPIFIGMCLFLSADMFTNSMGTPCDFDICRLIVRLRRLLILI